MSPYMSSDILLREVKGSLRDWMGSKRRRNLFLLGHLDPTVPHAKMAPEMSCNGTAVVA